MLPTLMLEAALLCLGGLRRAQKRREPGQVI